MSIDGVQTEVEVRQDDMPVQAPGSSAVEVPGMTGDEDDPDSGLDIILIAIIAACALAIVGGGSCVYCFACRRTEGGMVETRKDETGVLLKTGPPRASSMVSIAGELV